jgi:hypothetical protein
MKYIGISLLGTALDDISSDEYRIIMYNNVFSTVSSLAFRTGLRR